MLLGDKADFAIECDIEEYDSGFLFGHFRMWAGNMSIGDYEDWAALQGCAFWLNRFLCYSDDRFEPDLDDKPKEEVFRVIFEAFYETQPDLEYAENWDVLSKLRTRFHLNAIGMSSFQDKYDVILIERQDRKQRLIWRNISDMLLHEVILAPGEFERVANAFLAWLFDTPEWGEYRQAFAAKERNELAFKELIALVSSMLKEQGWKRRGHAVFCLPRAGNWGVIELVTNTHDYSDEVIFTIELCVASARIHQFLSGNTAHFKSPPIRECHWQQRLGFLLPIQQDKWWKVDAETPLAPLAQEIMRDLLDVGVPEMRKYLEDVTLRDLWLSGQAPGLTELQRLVYLGVLLKALGPKDLLDRIFEELRQLAEMPGALPMANVFLRRLQSDYAMQSAEI